MSSAFRHAVCVSLLPSLPDPSAGEREREGGGGGGLVPSLLSPDHKKINKLEEACKLM